jgi:fatty-acyl-CoA synthase
MARQTENEFPKTPANYIPLSPLSFVRRANNAFPKHPAVIYDDRCYTWSDIYRRACQLAMALRRIGIQEGDTVSIIAANTPELFEAHFGVPMAGAVLNTINIRLDGQTIAHILRHSRCRLLIADTQFSPAVKAALAMNSEVQVVDIVDDLAVMKTGEGERLGKMTYDELLSAGSLEIPPPQPKDEWDAIALNYTSGTSGTPKGVLYHHRGALARSLRGTYRSTRVISTQSRCSTVMAGVTPGLWPSLPGQPFVSAISRRKRSLTPSRNTGSLISAEPQSSCRC